MIKLSNQSRIRLLTTASATVAAVALASAANAGETVVTPAPFPTIATTAVDAHAIIDEVQVNIAAINASVSDSAIASESPATPTSATSTTVSLNTIAASASGNDFDNSIDLSVVPAPADLDDGDGAASLGFQVNFGPVTSSVTNNEISSNYTDFTLGSIEANGNTIATSTSGNSGTTSIAGDVLPEYGSLEIGSSLSTTDPAPDWLVATGGLVASTLQIQSDTIAPITNTATADGNNRILLNVLNTLPDSEVVASPELDDNTISATVSGNSSNSTIDVTGGTPTFAGSAVVTNAQVNSSPDTAGSAITAINEDSDVIAVIAADDINTTDDAELQGALSVSGNAITSNASGNSALGAVAGQAGNRILLADGMSFAGSGAPTPGADLGYDAGDETSFVSADLIINNSQGNVGLDADERLAITGSTDDGEIAAIVDDILGGAVTVQGNTISGAASGNAASSAFASGEGSPSFTGSAAVANQQSSIYVNVLAEGTGDIYAEVTDDDDLTDSQVLVDDNTVAATASGNSVSQSLTLDAVLQDLPLSGVTLTGGTDGALDDGNVASDGSLTVTNLQALYSVDVDAREVHNIYAASTEDETVENSGVAVTNNTAEAVSLGNSAGNTLALSGTTVGTGAGIVSVQINDDDGGDDADDEDGTAYSEGIVQLNAGDVDSGDLTVSGNLQRAIVYGGSAANALSVDATNLTADGAVSGVASTVELNGSSLTVDDQPLVEAAYGVLNIQSLNGDLAATAVAAGWTDGSSFMITVDSDVSGSTIQNGGKIVDDEIVGGNTLVAAAYGADASNSALLELGNLDTSNDDFASVANVTNVQEVSGESSVSAQAAGPESILTDIEADVDGSTVTTSFNVAQALAYGNRAANSLVVDANNIDTEADSFPFGIQGEAQVIGGVATTEASFGINNVQSAGGDITATLLDDLDEDDADSSVTILTVIGDSVTDSTVSSDGNALNAAATGNRAESTLEIDGNELATTAALTNFQNVAADSDIVSFIGIDGDDAPNLGGVIVQIGGAIDPSTVTVNGNSISGAVTGNSATNLVSVDGTDVADGSDHFLTFAIGDGPDIQADGDVMLASRQQVGADTDLVSAVYGTFAIDTNDDELILGSTLEIDGNSQASRAVANTVNNTAELVATNTAAGAALANSQTGRTDVSATSDVDIFAPVVSDGTNISMSENSNLALGVINDATNTLNVDTTNASAVNDVAPIDAIADADVDDIVAFGDHVLLNTQYAENSVSATASTTIINDDAGDLDTLGLVDGTVRVMGNTTTAEASSNRAVNVANVSAGSSLGASAALTNSQGNLADVTASATTSAGVTISGDDAPVAAAVNGANITLGDNTTSSLARGNAASNILNYSAGANYGAGTGDPANASVDAPFGPNFAASATAQAAVLNAQGNTGAVSATSTQVSYVVVLNGTGVDPLVTNATIGVIGNAVSATAYGNYAANAINLASLNTNMATAAVGNYQTNVGNISATATTVTIGTTSGLGAIIGSAVSVTSNAITASATGNSAVNAITGGL